MVARTLSDVAAGVLRLAHRALEVHGRDVGYETAAWIEHALQRAGAALDRRSAGEDVEAPALIEEIAQQRSR